MNADVGALARAIRTKDIAKMRDIMTRCPDCINQRVDDDGIKIPLFFKLRKLPPEFMELLLEHQRFVKINEPSSLRHTLLMEMVDSVHKHKYKNLEILLRFDDIDVSYKDFYGATAIMQACFEHDRKSIELLIAKDKRVLRDVDNDGRTVLHHAVKSHVPPEIILDLLRAGADKTVRNNEGYVALDYDYVGYLPPDIRNLLAVPKPPPPTDALYKGYTKSDAELFNQLFEEPNEWSCCPVCLAYVRRTDGCMYMKHTCSKEERHETLYKKFNDTGKIEWCTICGRITKLHRHFQNSLANSSEMPKFAPISPDLPAGDPIIHFDTDCKKVGGGGFEEKVRRIHRLLQYACELQDEVGKMSSREARDELIEEVWNAGDMRNRTVAKMISNKKFEFPCTFPEDAKSGTPAAEKVYPDIPRPADQKDLTPIKHDAPDNDCVVALGAHEDGRPTYEFRHKQANGSVVNHESICGPDIESTIRSQPIDGTCRIDPSKCKALLYPEELKDIVSPEFYETYRKLFNQANAVATGGAEPSLMRPLDMDTAECAPPQKAARRRRTRRIRKGRRKTHKK